MEKEELLRLFISLDFVTINPVVIIGYTIIILGEVNMQKMRKKTLCDNVRSGEELTKGWQN